MRRLRRKLKAEVEPAEVGLDPDRMRRIDRHFARYVDVRQLVYEALTG